jgi:aminoglycoside 2'-N-acetyltransferase I
MTNAFSAGSLSILVIKASDLTARQQDEILSVCSLAYEEDFAPYLQLLTSATHVLAYVGNELVSHAAWVERELHQEGIALLRTAYIEAVATLPEHQRKGYGGAVLNAIPPLIQQYDIGALSPSEQAFYARLGWVLWEGSLAYRQDAEVIETPEEEVMVYYLPKTPKSLNVKAQLIADWRPGEVW